MPPFWFFIILPWLKNNTWILLNIVHHITPQFNSASQKLTLEDVSLLQLLCGGSLAQAPGNTKLCSRTLYKEQIRTGLKHYTDFRKTTWIIKKKHLCKTFVVLNLTPFSCCWSKSCLSHLVEKAKLNLSTDLYCASFVPVHRPQLHQNTISTLFLPHSSAKSTRKLHT